MKKPVEVCVTGIHSRPGEPTEKVVTNSSGIYQDLEDGRYQLEYEEDQGLDGSSKVHNKILIASDGTGMEIVRGGENGNRLEFRDSLEYTTEYLTPYGSMNMKIITKSFDFNRSHHDLEMKLMAEYQLEMAGQVLSDSMIIIEIKNAATT
jgi:uncharacterized beta-barrel protein YwiB (DUF1934 family)